MAKKKVIKTEAPKRTFTAMMMPTADASVWDKWDYSIGIQSPKFVAAQIAHPGQDLAILMAFSGYGTDPHMFADIQSKWAFKQSDGTQILGEDWSIALKSRVLHGDFVLRPLNTTTLQIPKDIEPGLYHLELYAKCGVSRQSAEHHLNIEIRRHGLGKAMTQEEVVAFVDGYLDHPDPARFWEAYFGAFDSLGKNSPDHFFAFLPFFAQVLSDNLWLISTAEQAWQSLAPKHQAALSLVLHAARLDSANPELQALINQRGKTPFPSIHQLLNNPVTHPQELDFLWSIFKACGRFSVFKHICKSVSGLPEALAAVTEESTQEAIIKAAAWSIQQHLDQLPLALTYAMALFKESDLEIRVYRLLEGLLKQKGWSPNPDYVGP